MVSERAIEKFRLSAKPAFGGEIYEYAANFNLQKGYAIKGFFDVSISKYLIPVFQALKNPNIRHEYILKAIQTFGSGAGADLHVPYLIEFDPGDTLWLFSQGDDFAKDYVNERLIPLYSSSATLKPWLQTGGRFAITQSGLVMVHMSVQIGGLNEGNVHGLSKRVVIIDECWLAVGRLSGLIDKAIGRTKAFPQTSKVVLISQGGVKGSDWDQKWDDCNKQMWAWQCDACKKHQIFEFTHTRQDKSIAGMKWESNEFTRPNGRWNYTAAAKTARLECIHCGHQTEDTPAARRRLDDTHTYIVTNLNADESISGHQWPSIAKPDISFASVVSRYLRAKDQQEQHGHLLPLIQFHQQELAVNWDEAISADVRRITFEPYEIASEWKEEKHRFLTVDCQKDFKEFWFVVRAWAQSGESRQLDRGRLESWEQVRAKQIEWKVRDDSVFVDAGYEQTKVSDQCIQYGHIAYRMRGREKIKVWICWIMLKGSAQETFEHTNPQTRARDLKVYDAGRYLTPTRLPSEVGRSKVGVPFIVYSALHISDILRRHRDGEAAKWMCLPCVSSPDDLLSFTNQIHSHERVKERNDRGALINIWRPMSLGGEGKVNKKRPGHYFDCEKMQIVSALRRGVIGDSPQEQEEKSL